VLCLKDYLKQHTQPTLETGFINQTDREGAVSGSLSSQQDTCSLVISRTLQRCDSVYQSSVVNPTSGYSIDLF
jgi:hypothetical protein